MMYCEIVNRICINCGYEIPKKIKTIGKVVYTRNCPNYKNLNHKMTLLHTRDGNPAFLGNLFHDQACFFIGAGPSTLDQNLSILSSRGILTFSVNNAATIFKPNLWCCVDDPKSFHGSIWNDPTIMKFINEGKSQLHYYKQGKTSENSMQIARHCPNVFTFNTNGTREPFNHETFLSEKICCWGANIKDKDSLGIKGGRSVMLVAIKLMYFLGFKRIYLLGCDFNMQYDHNRNGRGLTYSFSQWKHKNGCVTNNENYTILNERFTALKPLLEGEGCIIKNCTPNSKLTVFDSIDFKEAFDIEYKQFSHPIKTEDMYG